MITLARIIIYLFRLVRGGKMMRLGERINGCLLGAAATLLLFGCNHKASVVPPGTTAATTAAALTNSTPKATEWKAPDAMVALLKVPMDSNVHSPKVSIRVPSGYDVHPVFKGRRKVFFFRGPQRKDGTAPVLLLHLVPKGKDDLRSMSVDEALRKALDGIKLGRKRNWTETRSELGTINGIIFQRVYWSGIEPITKRTSRGFLYVGPSLDGVIIISGQDFEPDVAKDLPLLEAAALSVKYAGD